MQTTLQNFREIFQAYHPVHGVFDEVAAEPGKLRPTYEGFVDELESLGRFEFSRRWSQAKRTLRDNGIAYSGYSGKAARPRTWRLDALPVILAAKEWEGVKQALAQRAQLLNLVLRDLYGPQKLLRDGVLPPSLVYSDPGFVRSCRELTLPEDCHLHLFAADVARAPDGNWWVLADRTEAPSGLGYVLEHRIVMSRMLPKAFGNSQVLRLAPFFAQLQETLQALAHHHRDNPQVVLLSDGTINPYHLEDAYLARYLGCLLVEDGDLAVRSSRVMLKTLGGLQPVDVVLRHQNSKESDPLEHTSVEGVAGLTQAVRAKEVAVANALGSGLLESSAYMAFTRRLCQTVLGEDLMLPNVATWWCGEPNSLKYVLENLDRLIIQPAFRRRGHDEGRRRQLQAMNSDQLAGMIRADPNAFAAQERVERSCVPVWGRQLSAERMAIRCYAVQAEDSYEVLDGGLGRVTGAAEPLEVSIHDGETSKDIWILSDEPVEFVTLLSEHRAKAEVRRSGANLPSRVADNLFWLGRRLERAEDHARLINITATRLAGETPYEDCPELPMLLRCMASEGLIEAGYAVESMRRSLPQITLSLPTFAFDSHQPDSLRSGIEQLVRLGSLVRDRLSVQAWRIIQRIDESVNDRQSQQMSVADLIEITDELMGQLAALSGIFMESMTRTQVFQFLDLGRRLERSQQILCVLRNGILAVKPAPRSLLETTLELSNSLMTYRTRYLANVHTLGVIDLTVTDETNPRSLAYQLSKAKQHIDQLPRDQNGESQASSGFSPEQKAIMSLLSAVQLFDVESIDDYGPDQAESLLEKWSDQVAALSNLLSHRYLVHAALPQQLTDMGE